MYYAIWIPKKDKDDDTYFKCSHCGASWYASTDDPCDDGLEFCPSCGSKMDSVPALKKRLNRIYDEEGFSLWQD